MLPEFGYLALMIALCLSLWQATFPLFMVHKRPQLALAQARSAALAQCFLVAFAFVVLAFSFATNDFSVVYVAENSNTKLPLVYRLCAVWGAHEGSMLLWVFILTIWMASVAWFKQSLPDDIKATVLSVLSWIAIGFYGFLLTTSNPFIRLLPNIPINGHDLNPILQDPGLVAHPPMLYMGYVGFSVAFAFAIAALIRGRFDAEWARWTRPWTLLAWCFLTLGIVLGSWWAYRELGWGGFWFWDPVENASFLPWLSATALIHVLLVAEKRDALKSWAIFLAVCTFSLSLLGTFLVRSGILISVHAFAVDSRRGLYLLEFLMLVVGASLLLYAWRSQRIVNTGRFSWLSRESLILSNNLMLFTAMCTILVGTLYPLIVDVLHLGKLSVGAPYFNAVFTPLILPLIFVMGIVPSIQWYRHKELAIKTLLIRFIVLLLLSAILVYLYADALDLLPTIAILLALWVLTNTLTVAKPSLRYLAMLFAHLGVVVVLIGLVFTSTYTVSKNLSLHLGESVSIGPYQLSFDRVDSLKGPNYSGASADFSVYRGKQLITKLHPEQRVYTVTQSAVAKTAIHATVFHDLYLALGRPQASETWGVRVYFKPFIRWIWFGGLMMVLGGLFAVLTLMNKRWKQ